MRKFFENPEMMINVFDVENIVTESLNPTSAKEALSAGTIKLDNQAGENIAAATQIFSFNE